MTVSSTNTASALTSSAEVTASGYDAFNDMGIEEFFKLMTTELQNQDPLDPMDNSEMLAQIAQIRDIAASDNLTNTLSSITSTFESVMLGQNMATASGMIGKTVKAEDDDGVTFTGEVTQVTITDGVPKLTCTEVVEAYVDEDGKTVEKHTVEHMVSLENIISIVSAGATISTTELSQQLSTASELVGKSIVASKGEEIVEETDDDGNVTETRNEVDSGLAGTVEKTLVEDGEVKVQIVIPAGTDTEERHVVVSFSDVEQVLPDADADLTKLTEELAVASSMVGRNVIGNVTGTDGETGTLGGLVQYAYVQNGQTMLAIQPPETEELYALALDEVTNVYGYSDGASDSDDETGSGDTTDETSTT